LRHLGQTKVSNRAEFIAHAPADIARLLSALAASEAEVERLRQGWPNRPERHEPHSDEIMSEIVALENRFDIELVSSEHNAYVCDLAESYANKMLKARRWAAAWKRAAKKLWKEDRAWGKHSLVQIVDERNQLRAEVDGLSSKLDEYQMYQENYAGALTECQAEVERLRELLDSYDRPLPRLPLKSDPAELTINPKTKDNAS